MSANTKSTLTLVGERSALLNVHLVDVAPAPVLAGLERLHDGVASGVEMLRGVPVF